MTYVLMGTEFLFDQDLRDVRYTITNLSFLMLFQLVLDYYPIPAKARTNTDVNTLKVTESIFKLSFVLNQMTS